jgi:hypothetical protein
MILEFMRQFQFNPVNMGNPGLKGKPSTLGPYVVHAVNNT